MKQLFSMAIAILFTIQLAAQETFMVTLNQDNAFGFAPGVFGSFPMNDQLSFTYYGLFWTNNAYSNNFGQNSWLETGVGVGFLALDGKAFINPSLGFTHGNLLSGSQTGAAGEGIVPNLAIFYTGDYTELEFYGGYYKALKDGGNSNDFLLYWVYPGLRLTENISAGLHYEEFYLTRDDAGDSGSWYQWMGGYVKFAVDGKYSVRFSSGTNLSNSGLYADSYYKLSVGIPLL